MLSRLISLSVRHRFLVLGAALALVASGAFTAARLPVDVLPEVVKPTVTVLTEAPGLAPEEAETLVTAPIEAALRGARDLTRVRSTTTAGHSVVHAEFAWGTTDAAARQAVAERLAAAAPFLPPDRVPVVAPVSSLLGEVVLVGLTRKGEGADSLELRSLADTVVRSRLQSVPGVSQVTVIGGGVAELQVRIDPVRLSAAQLSIADVEAALGRASANAAGGILEHRGRELVVRVLAATASPQEIGATVVTNPDGVRVPIASFARVERGARPRVGDAGVDGEPAVILAVSKQPGARTLDVSARLDEVLESLRSRLGSETTLRVLFRQSRFLDTAFGNVGRAVRDGTLLVALVILVFLANVRATVVTLAALPLSFAASALVFSALGLTLDAMTLGGLAIASGELVDDAVVGVENVFRRLRENARGNAPASALRVVFAASAEVRGSVVFATLLVVAGALPLLAVPGVEGRLFASLGFAYLTAVVSSFVVSVTATPALAAILLPRARAVRAGGGDAPLVRLLKRLDEKLLRWALPRASGIAVAALLVAVAAAIPLAQRAPSLLPPFEEESATVTLAAPAGTPLSDSSRIGVAAERLLLSMPEVASTGRRTGRAELDEHAEGPNVSEIDVAFRPGIRYGRAQLLEAIRRRLDALPGPARSVGQPIGHRLEHLLSGVEAPVFVKIFGPDLGVLRRAATDAAAALRAVPGVTDVAIEPLDVVPRLAVRVRRPALASHGSPPGELAGTLEAAFAGRTVGRVVDGGRSYDVVLRYDDPWRASPEAIRSARVRLPDGATLPVGEVADVEEVAGPDRILREDGRRRIVVSASLAARGVDVALRNLEATLGRRLTFPSPDYHVESGGRFREERVAIRSLLLVACGSFLAVVALLYARFRSALFVLQILVNVPLALVGSALALVASGEGVSLVSLVGFLTVAGIASRNSILMLSHYLHLLRHEGETFGVEMIVRGSLERLVPVLMTAGTAALALVPVAWTGAQPGKEILAPLAVVVLGGLASSTLIDAILTPALFFRFGGRAAGRLASSGESEP